MPGCATNQNSLLLATLKYSENLKFGSHIKDFRNQMRMKNIFGPIVHISEQTYATQDAIKYD